MKKLLVAAILSSTSVGAFAYDAQVNFNGEVLDQTCAVNGNTDGSTVVNVTLPKVNKSALAGAESWAGNTPFQFKLTNCPVQATKAKWEVTGQVDAAGTLVNTIAGTNATVRLIDPANSYINIQSDAGYSFTPAADGSATLNYMAQYYSQAGSATAGKLQTVGYWTLTY
ncbi:fimbrial protein [Pseudomonas sp. PDM19]|uniref:fimbrial protein n=1 Tax=Pseudomonas sp. PDM19 TaxID=2769272 RepID=UPI0017807C87|nr:fimbrial protein [Pseudomonas sp. PDM19]MBD9631771.1 type 1 fimbrial protein [Pseudomonas sp. PDM19]